MTEPTVSRDPSIDIIPHNHAIRQAILSTKSWQNHTSFPARAEKPTGELVKTSLQAQALRLYDLGLNVFPQPLGRKSGLSWQRLQYTRLHRDDSHYGLLPLFAGRCNLAIMCGKTSRNLFVIDCDTEEALNLHMTEIRKRGIPLWAVKTARGGHIYLRCEDGEVANIDQGTIPGVEIKGCRRYVLAPPSVHPSGVIYCWMAQEGAAPPTVNHSSIDWLHNETGQPVELKLDREPSRHTTGRAFQLRDLSATDSRLSRSTRDYLTNGHTLPQGCRNNRLFSAACDMAGNSYSEQDTLDRLLPIALASGLPASEITSTIKSAFSRERKPAKPQATAQTKRRDWQRALHYAHHHNWQGRCRETDKTTFLALVERARLSANENGTFRASVREIAALARQSTTTTQKALRRLATSKPPLIVRAGSDKTSKATLWRFHKAALETEDSPHPQSKTDTLPPSTPWIDGSVSLFHSDVLERGALGRVGVGLYRVMLSLGCPAMPSRLAEGAGVRVHQVNYALKKLRRFGLVERVEGGWTAVLVDDCYLVEGVPALAGAAGKGEARRRRFAEERAIHVGRLILAERYRREGRFSVSVAHCDLSVLDLPDSFGENARGRVRYWRCPNCGQTYFGDPPPDMCAVCNDFTTWAEVASPGGVDGSRDSASSDGAGGNLAGEDPLLSLALELGGVVVEDDWAGP